MENKLNKYEDNGNIIIAIEGDLDIQLIYDLKEQIGEEFEKGNYTITLNFQKVNTINSTALGVLVSRLRVAKQNKGDLIVTNLNSYIQKIFDMVGASKIFTIVEPNNEMDS